MTKFIIYIAATFFFLFMSEVFSFANPYSYLLSKPLHAVGFSDLLLQRQKQRFDMAQMDKVCRVLNIKKDMVILDIGTGSGQYAYKFAEELQGTGHVFATDINPDMINYVKKQIQERHLNNVTPVLVKPEGVDDFYGRNTYDLIFIAHTLQYIPHHDQYLGKMKNYLKPHGFLIVLKNKKWPNFNLKCFTDIKGLLKRILQEKPDSPFYKYLAPFQVKAKKILEGGAINPNFLFELAACFHDMSRDGDFFVPFLDKNDMVLKRNVRISPQERLYVNTNLSFFKEFSVQDQERGVDFKSPNLNSANYFIMRNINRVLIISEFQEFLYGGKPPYLPGGDVHQEIREDKKDFESFGYKLVQSYDFIPNEILLVFSPKD